LFSFQFYGLFYGDIIIINVWTLVLQLCLWIIYSSQDSKLSGAFLDAWRAHLSKFKFETADVTNAMGTVMAVREESEINTVKKACQVRMVACIWVT
jgi:hypothetical protein